MKILEFERKKVSQNYFTRWIFSVAETFPFLALQWPINSRANRQPQVVLERVSKLRIAINLALIFRYHTFRDKLAQLTFEIKPVQCGILWSTLLWISYGNFKSINSARVIFVMKCSVWDFIELVNTGSY